MTDQVKPTPSAGPNVPARRRRDKAEIQSIALGVVVSWLRQESHADDELGGLEMQWCVEAQERIACFVELECVKLQMKSKTYRRKLAARSPQN